MFGRGIPPSRRKGRFGAGGVLSKSKLEMKSSLGSGEFINKGEGGSLGRGRPLLKGEKKGELR